MRVILVILFLMFLGGFFIISEQKLALGIDGNSFTFLEIYGSWIEGLFTNSVEITGMAVGLDWLPKNKSLSG